MIPLMDVLIAAKWLIALYLCGVLGTLLFVKTGPLTALRYSLGKAVGVIGIAAITWILSIFKIMSFTATTILIVLAVLYALVIFIRWKQITGSIKKNWRAYIIIELVFILLFVLGIAIRSSLPKAEGIEKFMDAAILSNLMRHGLGTPVDTWYAPNDINYYYFGHWIIAMIAKMSSTTIGYAFNLGFASSLAITGTSIFCLGKYLSKKYIGGALALFLALFASNLHPFIMFLSGSHNYFFFNSGRFIEQVINEYPLYSIILGDLHAHMLSLMLTTALYTAVVLMIFDKNYKNKIIFASVSGILTGLLAATNSFDVIAGGLVFGLALIWMIWRKKLNLKKGLILGLIFTVLFALLLEVFMMHFKPAVGGVAISLFKTPVIHMFYQFGALIIILGVSLVIVLKNQLTESNRKKVEVALILAIAGLFLMLLPQFIYFRDIYHFQNPPFARANTVFKIWYAAWPLLAISSATMVVFAITAFKKKYKKVIFCVVVFLCCSILTVGTFKGVTTLNDEHSNTLDGIDYIQKTEPSKLDVINWANQNIDSQPMVAQAPGESYSQQSWFSSYTGLPSVIGWRSHEWGWRYSQNQWNYISIRGEALKRLYESATPSELRQTVSQLNVDYVLVGPDERAIYLINDSLFSNTFGAPVFSSVQYQIYSTK